MRIPKSLLVASLSTVLLLTGCSAPSEVSDPVATSKEAGALGTRICFTNSTGLPMSAAPGGRVIETNSNFNVGEPGEVGAQNERCFAGRNSYQIYSWWQGYTSSSNMWQKQDVAVSISVDGNYGKFVFAGLNEWLGKPHLCWSDSSNPTSFPGADFEVGETKSINRAGYNFSVSRRADSENYKEFAVQFTP